MADKDQDKNRDISHGWPRHNLFETKIEGTKTGRVSSTGTLNKSNTPKAITPPDFYLRLGDQTFEYRKVEACKVESIVVDKAPEGYHRLILQGPWQGVYGRPYWIGTYEVMYSVGYKLAERLGIGVIGYEIGTIENFDEYAEGYKLRLK